MILITSNLLYRLVQVKDDDFMRITFPRIFGRGPMRSRRSLPEPSLFGYRLNILPVAQEL